LAKIQTGHHPRVVKHERNLHRVKWRYSNLWSHYTVHVVGQHGVLCCKVKWWRFVALFE